MRISQSGSRTIGSSRGELVRSAKDETKRPPKPQGGTESSKPNRNLGDALRQAYNEAVREAVPDDLLDLLKKLD
nr:NepR family anti-sigma factor [Sphingomonas naasensis]